MRRSTAPTPVDNGDRQLTGFCDNQPEVTMEEEPFTSKYVPPTLATGQVFPAVFAGTSSGSTIPNRFRDDDQLGDSLANDLNRFLESRIFRLSDYCCRKRMRTSDLGSCDALLSDFEPNVEMASEVENVSGESTSDRRTFEAPIKTVVENWMRRRLIYFFMSPREKYYAKRRYPFKLFIQLLKVVVITVQLIVFGLGRSAHVAFGEDSRQAFSHLYLLDWEPQYETLEYPPAAGPYAFYQRSQFYQAIGFAITQFNLTEEIAIGGYLFDSDDPEMTLCLCNVSSTVDSSGTTNELFEKHCVTIHPQLISSTDLVTPTAVERFLDKQTLSIDFSALLNFNVQFTLLSPVISQLGWTHDSECFRFNIQITMQKNRQSGILSAFLDAPYTFSDCGNVVDANQSASLRTRLQMAWNKRRLNATRPQITSHNLSWRRVVVGCIHSVALILAAASCVLCVRSVVRNFATWKETVIFFHNWYHTTLYGYFWTFVPPWFLFTIMNDVLIFISSACCLFTLSGRHHKPDPISYVFGLNVLFVWFGVLRYVGYSHSNSILTRTIIVSLPALLRFGVCSLILFFAFSLCGWVVLGPYNLKFRTFVTTLECLFSLINGDDMFVTFSVVGERAPWGIFIFSRLFLYVFITLFIYVVLNLFITIIFEAYEEVKNHPHTHPGSRDSFLRRFIGNHPYDCRSPEFRHDDTRADHQLLRWLAFGRGICNLNRHHLADSDCFHCIKVVPGHRSDQSSNEIPPPAGCSSTVSFVSQQSDASANHDASSLRIQVDEDDDDDPLTLTPVVTPSATPTDGMDKSEWPDENMESSQC